MDTDKETKTDSNLPIFSVSGSIVVSELKNRPNQRQITSNSNWFNCDYILFNVEDGCISITKPDLDYRGKSHKPTKQNNWWHFLVTAELPFGKFEFDVDDSTEDELIVYYR